MVHYSISFTAYKAASGGSCFRCGIPKRRVQKAKGYQVTPKKQPTIKGAPFYCELLFIVGYFFVVLGKLFTYSLRYFLRTPWDTFAIPHRKLLPPLATLITDGTLLLQLQAYKVASGGSNFRCGIAKSIPGSTQTASLGQQKSSPQ